jgi:hypothetical protein
MAYYIFTSYSQQYIQRSVRIPLNISLNEHGPLAMILVLSYAIQMPS